MSHCMLLIDAAYICARLIVLTKQEMLDKQG